MSGRTVRVVLEAVVQNFQTRMRDAGRTARTAGAEMAQVAERNAAAFTTLGIAVGGAGIAVAAMLRKAGQEAIQFESALTKSVTLIGVSRQEMDELGAAALRMAHTGQGPLALADALFFVQSAGFAGSDAMSVVEASAKAASIGLGDVATVADLVTSAVNAYGIENL
jgi:hypothetical protein